jgi:hypothetical protein
MVTKQEVKKLKSILDKLQVHYILDHVSFHDTVSAVELMKEIHKVKAWKVEKDGSVSLNNRFGHSGLFKYQYIYIPRLLEVAIVDWDILSVEEVDFLDQLICRYECMPMVQHRNSAPSA